MKKFDNETVDLIYIDPPFFSGKKYECVFNDEPRWFHDTWAGMDDYMLMMEEVLRNCHRLLKPTGSIYVHLDWHAVHYVKVKMDTIFGYGNFRNEIAWCYRKWSVAQSQFARNHDTILFYTKSDKNTFNTLHVPLSESTLKRWKGKKQNKTAGTDGKLVDAGASGKSEGSAMPDWWEVPVIAPVAKERLGYPTQKPEALLERIIKASSDKDDIVLDPMCGCGTCVAVAKRLGRDFIGIDFSKLGCALVAERIHLPKSSIIGLKVGMEYIRDMNPSEFQSWVCRELFAQRTVNDVHDMGIDGTLMDGTPIQVKQSARVGREVVDKFQSAIRRVRKDKGILVAYSFTRGTKNEVARLRMDDNIEIELLTAEEILARDE
jgi:DNA modification methylase